MRRALLMAAAVGTLFLTAACGKGTDTGSATPTGSSAISPSSAVSPGPAVSLVARETSCLEFETASTEVGKQLLASMEGAFDVLGETDEAKIEAAMAVVVTKMKAAVSDYRAAVSRSAAAAGDAAIKTELTTIADELTKIEAEFAKVTTAKDVDSLPKVESAAMDAAAARLEALCK